MKTTSTLFIVLLLAFIGRSQDSFNMNLEANWDDNGLPSSGGLSYNDCWGYNASNGTEVAILGTLQRVYFFDVSDPSDPEIIDYFTVLNENGTTNNSIWRDFKTYDHYAYASADQGTTGLLIFDLQYVPDSVVLVAQNQDFWLRSHNIWIDVPNGRLYAAGPNTNSGGTIVLDLATDPEDPVEIGSPTLPLGYIHDIHVVDHIAYASHGSDQALSIYDFTDAEDPILIRTLEDYPEPGYNHSSWLDASGTRLVFADETWGQALKLVNPNLTDHQSTNYHLFQSQLLENNPNSIAHNPFIKDDLCYIAYYHDGVQIFDISDTNDITRVAYYDTYSNTNYDGYEGCWGVYPFLESGYIVASDISNGLFVLSVSGDVLPLNFIAFDAVKKSTDAIMTWKVTAPDDGEYFFVEHSKDGVAFETIAELPAQKHTLTYQSLHTDPGPGMHYYRVVVRHLDGAREYTHVRQIQFEMDEALIVKPTLVDDMLRVDTRASGQISLISVDGKQLLSSEAGELERLELNVGYLPAGQYYVILRSGDLEYTTAFTKK
ncbi:MAG TPA: choice-of-anchor B family protein [Saprospiraceae bacterium]|nr:choice-of-anchor B family protein [Saprospiraceae bacterium]